MLTPDIGLQEYVIPAALDGKSVSAQRCIEARSFRLIESSAVTDNFTALVEPSADASQLPI